jgi:hypothetical protein
MTTVRYLVRGVDQSVAFYTQHLGFAVKQQFGPNMAIVTRDGLTLWLAGPGASAARPMLDGRRPEPAGWNRFVLEVVDLGFDKLRLRSDFIPVRAVLIPSLSKDAQRWMSADDRHGGLVRDL